MENLLKNETVAEDLREGGQQVASPCFQTFMIFIEQSLYPLL